MERPERIAGIERLLDGQPWDALIPHLLKAGADPEPTIERLRSYTRSLLEWNRRVSNLVSRHDEHRIVERHIAESIEPAAWLRASAAQRWLDFGSGAGLPAIPLALAGVGTRWTVVESRRMKTLFMSKMVQDFSLHDFEVVNARLERIADEEERQSKYEAFTSRATLALGPTLVLAARFIAPGGVAYLWKGSKRESEMASDPRWQESWELDGLLGLGQGQSVVAKFVRKDRAS